MEKEMKIEYQPIGIIHSPFNTLSSMPIQPAGAKGVNGTIEIFPQYLEGLKDLEGFSHIIMLYHFHQSEGFKLSVVPFLDTIARGIFSTRAPKRPNAIGLSVIKLQSIQDNMLHIENVDVLDGTPLLDIKPYVTAFDVQTEVKMGWLEQTSKAVKDKRSDERFL
jgi:tRNA (adenine37-N6)-methyltransferase